MNQSLSEAFEDRLTEIDQYLDFLHAIQDRISVGALGEDPATRFISPDQQRMLYSSFYLQLYNLVESTVVGCLTGVAKAVTDGNSHLPAVLSAEVRKELIRAKARTHQPIMAPEQRLSHAVELCEIIMGVKPIASFTIETGSGSWDDEAIYAVTARIGLDLRVSDEANRMAKQPVRNGRGALVVIKDLRNDLAHGSISFVQCSTGATVTDLQDLKERVATYLKEVTAAFDTFLESYSYLHPSHRPAGNST